MNIRQYGETAMTQRRNILQFAAATAMVAPFAGFTTPAAAQGAPLFRFGVVADPQYAPVPPNLTLQRYYSNSLWKLSEAITAFNKEDLAFVVTLGDIIDRGYESYAHVLPLYDKLRHPRFFLLGNHDYSVAADYLASVLRTAGMQKAYYDFTGGGYRFVVLDGNDVSLFSTPAGSEHRRLAAEKIDAMKKAGAANAQTYNGTLSDAQFDWLEATLAKAAAAGERTIVMGHYPIFPANEANLWDDERLVKALTRHANVVAYFNGHNHKGNYGEVAGKHFVNFCGMVDTPDTTAYAVVEVFADRLVIRGTGREPNRTLKI
jgi:3',5'-cyclic AMP phosphodiesterase CpdA